VNQGKYVLLKSTHWLFGMSLINVLIAIGEIMQILSASAFYKVPLNELLTNFSKKEKNK
jgi:hypothetical protein